VSMLVECMTQVELTEKRVVRQLCGPGEIVPSVGFGRSKAQQLVGSPPPIRPYPTVERAEQSVQQ